MHPRFCQGVLELLEFLENFANRTQRHELCTIDIVEILTLEQLLEYVAPTREMPY
jgi:NADPH-dependent 7-cyano-7-deazaguanine reductase QueF